MSHPALIFPATLARAIRLIWQSGRRLSFSYLALTLGQALVPLLSLYAVKQVIDGLPAALAIAKGRTFGPELFNALLASPAVHSCLVWMALGTAALLLATAFRMALYWIGDFLQLSIGDRVYALLQNAMTRADYAFFENANDQNRLYLAREQALTRPPRILAEIGQLLAGSAGIGGVVLLLAKISWWLPALMLAAAVPVLCFRFFRSRRFYEWRKRLVPIEREADYFHAVLTDNAGAKDIRLYGHAGYCRARFQHARDELRKERIAWRKYTLSRDLGGSAVGMALFAALACWMGWRALAGGITVGTLVLCFQAVRKGQSGVVSLTGALAALFEDAVFLQSFEELIRQPLAITAPAEPRALPPSLRQGIVFDRVSFTYPGQRTPVFENLSFTLRPGQRTLLAGPNGSGKSTLVKLLCRLYDPTSGRILVDGIDLREFDPTEWRSKIGCLFQDFNHYQLTAAETIWIGNPSGDPFGPAVRSAAAEAGVSSLIESWPQGYATELGRWLHDGLEPSIGQWQKLALARAFLRPALLYLLDEPTSALDPAAQQETFEALARIGGPGRIVLLSSHHEQALIHADQTIRL